MLENLRALRKASNKTQKEVATDLGVSVEAYRSWEQQKYTPITRRAVEVAEYFHVSLDDLIGDGIREDAKKVAYKIEANDFYLPMYGSISAGWNEEPITNIEQVLVTRDVIAKYPDSFFLRVSGNSMNKIIKPGMLALIDPHGKIDDGDVIAVYINGNDATLKRYYNLANGIKLVPDSSDPTFKEEIIDFNDDKNFGVVGKLVWYLVPLDLDIY